MFLQVYMIGAIIVLGMMAIQWLMSLRLRDSSIVDIFWGFGFVVLAWAYFFLTSDGVPARKMLISILTTIWGLRLTMHILIRNWGKGEDFRYAKWREEAGPKWWWLSFFKVFLLQGVIMWIVSTPLLAAQIAQLPNQITVMDGIGFIVWGIGFFFEAVGDWQLRRFKSSPDNKGKLLTSGVWRYTRHPNYFGDAAQWWGFYLIAFAAGGWWTIFSPIIMTTLLVRVSGVVMLERTLMDSKPGYREYTESTSPFIPWLPRKVSNEEPAMIDFE